jgi:ABC-type antimicrobial peptide transport system permease subunit
VIGVVGDAKLGRLGGDDRVAFYIPLPSSNGWGSDPVILARTRGDPNAIARGVTAVIRELDPGMWSSAYSLESSLASSEVVSVQRTLGASASGLGLLALLLAAIGLYSMMAFGVAQRTRELGIRIALGAERVQVIRLALDEAIRYVGMGLVLGICAGVAASKIISVFVHGLRPLDPIAIGGVSAFLALVAVLAALAPARRAAAVDPVMALRSEY